MFGEKNIVINRELRLNPQNQIIIPADTGIVTGDEVAIRYGLHLRYIEIFNNAMLLKSIRDYLDALKEAYHKGQINYLEYERYQRRICSHVIRADLIISSRHRLNIPVEIVRDLEFTDSVYAVGNKNHLELYKDEATYEEISSLPGYTEYSNFPKIL